MPSELKRYTISSPTGILQIIEDPNGEYVKHGAALHALGHEANRAELLAEDIECLHMCLDKAGVPRKAACGETYSLWGRVLRFKDPNAPDPVPVHDNVIQFQSNAITDAVQHAALDDTPVHTELAPLADICAHCDKSLHPNLCPTAYVSCPLEKGR